MPQDHSYRCPGMARRRLGLVLLLFASLHDYSDAWCYSPLKAEPCLVVSSSALYPTPVGQIIPMVYAQNCLQDFNDAYGYSLSTETTCLSASASQRGLCYMQMSGMSCIAVASTLGIDPCPYRNHREDLLQGFVNLQDGACSSSAAQLLTNPLSTMAGPPGKPPRRPRPPPGFNSTNGTTNSTITPTNATNATNTTSPPPPSPSLVTALPPPPGAPTPPASNTTVQITDTWTSTYNLPLIIGLSATAVFVIVCITAGIIFCLWMPKKSDKVLPSVQWQYNHLLDSDGSGKPPQGPPPGPARISPAMKTPPAGQTPAAPISPRSGPYMNPFLSPPDTATALAAATARDRDMDSASAASQRLLAGNHVRSSGTPRSPHFTSSQLRGRASRGFSSYSADETHH
jgi:hypothetical protein